jgi:NADPH:quinone reductase-like Zn-dependent oxidoreductase
MKAFIVDNYGGPDRVRAGETPDPEVGENDVLVQVHAAGVNPGRAKGKVVVKVRRDPKEIRES